jgi:hypothetical protein
MGGEMKRISRRQPGQISAVLSSIKEVLQNAQRGGKTRSINPLTIPFILSLGEGFFSFLILNWLSFPLHLPYGILNEKEVLVNQIEKPKSTFSFRY